MLGSCFYFRALLPALTVWRRRVQKQKREENRQRPKTLRSTWDMILRRGLHVRVRRRRAAPKARVDHWQAVSFYVKRAPAEGQYVSQRGIARECIFPSYDLLGSIAGSRATRSLLHGTEPQLLLRRDQCNRGGMDLLSVLQLT